MNDLMIDEIFSCLAGTFVKVVALINRGPRFALVAAAVAWRKMSSANQRATINACFDSTTGHGYTLFSAPVKRCDFSTNNYDEMAGL